MTTMSSLIAYDLSLPLAPLGELETEDGLRLMLALMISAAC